MYETTSQPENPKNTIKFRNMGSEELEPIANRYYISKIQENVDSLWFFNSTII